MKFLLASNNKDKIREFREVFTPYGVEVLSLKDLNIDIDPEIVDPDDIETLSDILVAAVNEAIKKVNSTTDEEMGKITGGMGMGMGLPGMF